jgi:signal transduction histidine kinase/GGDEF domain-containing protein
LQQLEKDIAGGQQAGGLVFFELENLGLLRERIGLTALEILLGDVARLLTQTLGEQPATRFGDGSFLVLDRQREELALDSLATQVRQVLMDNAFQALGHPLRLRLSAGVAAFKHGFRQADTMINAVEKIARDARSHERGVRRYEPPRAVEALKEATLLGLVREAIADDTLSLLYQPVVAVAGSELSQYQTLLRLRDPDGNMHSAAEIIPMAERSSLIVEIDRWVMGQALALIHERQAEGQQLRLFVTQSSLTLAAPDQVAWLTKELRDANIAGDAVVIELRLDDVAVHLGTVKHFCEAMASEQVRFCLSQFEAGRESESLIDQLPLGFVKLARKYTAGTLGPQMREELKALIARVHRHHLQVIGHGVEDAQAAATLWMSGIDFHPGQPRATGGAGHELRLQPGGAVMRRIKRSDFLVVRWLAIAGALGAAIAQAIAYFTEQAYWNTVAFVAALLAVAAIAALWRAFAARDEALEDVVQESAEQQRVMAALQRELEIQRNLERELVEAKKAAESAVMAKGEFLATMSHEIRTPLNGIIPMLDLLMNSRLPPDQQDFLRTAYTSSRQMLRIVDDILDYSKLEANKLQLETTSFNLRDLLDSIIRLMEKPAEAKGLKLHCNLDDQVRLALRGDPVRLRQVLTNLISNALKFTERGAITLAVTRKGETRTQHELRFEVRDTGIGISKDNIKNLFRAFAQATRPRRGCTAAPASAWSSASASWT